MVMKDEYDALIENKTWELVPHPTDANVIRSLWFFRHKKKNDGSFERYKARLVGNGSNQQTGVDCGETFSPVVKPATVVEVAMEVAITGHKLSISATTVGCSTMECTVATMGHATVSAHMAATSTNNAQPPYASTAIQAVMHTLSMAPPDDQWYIDTGATSHMTALKRIIRYIKGTITHGLHLSPSSVDKLTTYTDADWGGCPDTRRSRISWCC
ncbi:copia protein [Trifolium medium]|uniref:Copia protein n=1 Tax=Trifolium medium TaxID=97028 RepID=A0A392NTH5_9FABA|nr:copia protein [Trifolium medium]